MNTLVVIFVPAAGSPEEVEAALLLRLRSAEGRHETRTVPCDDEPGACRNADSLVRKPGDPDLRGQGRLRSLQWATESPHDPEIAHYDPEPIRVRNAGSTRQCSAGVGLLPDESGVPMRRFMGTGDTAPPVNVPAPETRDPEELALWTWFIRNPDH